MGSPPPPGSKNDVFAFRSVSNIVIAPASTGRDSRSRTAVMKTDQENSGVCCGFCLVFRVLMIVLMKFMAPMIELAPARCREKIVRSTDAPA